MLLNTENKIIKVNPLVFAPTVIRRQENTKWLKRPYNDYLNLARKQNEAFRDWIDSGQKEGLTLYWPQWCDPGHLHEAIGGILIRKNHGDIVTHTQVFNANGTFSAFSGSAVVELYGPGGNGGGNDSGTYTVKGQTYTYYQGGGGGGGGGAYAYHSAYTVSGSEAVVVAQTVATNFNASAIVAGRGTNGTSSLSNGTGGAGGTASGGETNYSGGAGANGLQGNYGGGGGGAAGPGGAGNAGSTSTGGAGDSLNEGTPNNGDGGNGGSNANGSPGNNLGGGGGGGEHGSSGVNGGTGAPGRANISWQDWNDGGPYV